MTTKHLKEDIKVISTKRGKQPIRYEDRTRADYSYVNRADLIKIIKQRQSVGAIDKRLKLVSKKEVLVDALIKSYKTHPVTFKTSEKAYQRTKYDSIRNEIRSVNKILPQKISLKGNRETLVSKLVKVNKDLRDTFGGNSINGLNVIETKINAINGWHWSRFSNLNNDTTLKGFYNTISATMRATDFRGAYVVLYFVYPNRPTQWHQFTINGEYTGTFEDFEGRYNDIINGDIDGSDKYVTEAQGTVLNMRVFGLFKTRLLGGSKSENMIFECEGIDSPKNKCSQEVLKRIGYEADSKVMYLNEMINFLIKNKAPVEIINNSFLLSKKSEDEIRDRESYFIDNVIGSKKKGNKYKVTDLLNQDIELDYLYRPERKEDDDDEMIIEHTIIYDIESGHFDLIKNNHVRLTEGILISLTLNVFKKIDDKYKLLFTPKIMNNNNKKLPAKKHKYIIFDYETVIEFKEKSCMKTYSLSYFVCSDFDLSELDEAETKNDKEKIKQIEQKVKNVISFNCSKDLIDYITNNQEQTVFTLISFRGSTFDNHLLLDYLQSNKKDDDSNYVIQNNTIRYSKNKLMKFYINQHSTWDLANHLTQGTLSSLCKDYNINLCAKKSFDHFEAQRLYEEGTLIEKMNNNEELKTYNNYDVLSTALLFYRYKRALNSIEITRKYSKKLTDYMTIGSIDDDLFLTWRKEKNIDNFPKLSSKMYNDIIKDRIGGRVQVFNGGVEHFERVSSLDMISAYPFVLSVLNVYYPCGEIKDTLEYVQDKIGFYYCNIDQSILKIKNLPNIICQKTKTGNDWTVSKIDNILISSPTYELLIKYNCKVDIISGIYFTDKIKSCDLYGFMFQIMKAKNDQDRFKAEKSKFYNPSLRSTWKLINNSVSGKMNEKIHLKKTIVSSLSQYTKNLTNKDVVSTNVINATNDTITYTQEVTEDSQINKQRPVYLGMLCYDYQKIYMYENLYSKIGLRNSDSTDTDSLKFRTQFIEEWKEYAKNQVIPHWPEVEKFDERYKTLKMYNEGDDKIFGAFTDELENNNYFYTPKNKMWVVANIEKDEEGNIIKESNVKFACGGVSQRSIMITSDESEQLLIMNDAARFKFYTENMDRRLMYETIKDGITEQSSNVVKFFRQLKEDKEVKILTQIISPSVTNLKRDVKIDQNDKFNTMTNKILSYYAIKTIKI